LLFDIRIFSHCGSLGVDPDSQPSTLDGGRVLGAGRSSYTFGLRSRPYRSKLPPNPATAHAPFENRIAKKSRARKQTQFRSLADGSRKVAKGAIKANSPMPLRTLVVFEKSAIIVTARGPRIAATCAKWLLCAGFCRKTSLQITAIITICHASGIPSKAVPPPIGGGLAGLSPR